MKPAQLLQAATAITFGPVVAGLAGKAVAFQAWGNTTAGVGKAVIQIDGYNGTGGWETIGTITLTLGTTRASDKLHGLGGYDMVRARVREIVGTGARVSASVAGPLQESMSRTLTLDDDQQVINADSPTPITYTVPAGLPAGFACAFAQAGAGKVTIAAAAGVTLVNVSNQYSTSAQKALIAVLNTGPDTYQVVGDTGA